MLHLAKRSEGRVCYGELRLSSSFKRTIARERRVPGREVAAVRWRCTARETLKLYEMSRIRNPKRAKGLIHKWLVEKASTHEITTKEMNVHLGRQYAGENRPA